MFVNANGSSCSSLLPPSLQLLHVRQRRPGHLSRVSFLPLGSNYRWTRCRALAEHGPWAKHDTGHLVDISPNCTFIPPSAPSAVVHQDWQPGSRHTAGAAPLAASRISCKPGGGWLPHRDLQLPHEPHLHMNHPHFLARALTSPNPKNKTRLPQPNLPA